ncbi:hypothetical protein AB0F25_26710 [Streptomyces wedmorensis]|uniref:hypothetical protein n=1 Tax=Streptomyces wedmorensis TaxID=43759 RepID=UPI003429FA46
MSARGRRRRSRARIPYVHIPVAGVLGGYLAAVGYWLLFAVDAGSMLLFALVVALQPFATAWLARLPQLAVQSASSALIALGVALTGPANYTLSVVVWSLGEVVVAALTLGVATYTTLGPATLWWATLLAGTTTAAATLVLTTRVTRRTTHTLAA